MERIKTAAELREEMFHPKADSIRVKRLVNTNNPDPDFENRRREDIEEHWKGIHLNRNAGGFYDE